MEMHQIRYFLAVARNLNFTHAAEECHVAQPSLSRAIQKLEAEFGGELFRRERGLTHMTELGRLVFPLLTQCFESAHEAKKLAQAYGKGGIAPLRVSVSIIFGTKHSFN
jgi:DNA-binding transcriptional LysR family regulator